MKCPTCDVELKMTERASVEIDYCPNCRGVWLDRGELDKIIERARVEQGAAQNPRVAQSPPVAPDLRYDRRYDPERDRDDDRYRHRDDDYSKKNKRKSFLDDIFDF